MKKLLTAVVATGALTSFDVATNTVKLRQWHRSAETEFWKASHVPAPEDYRGKLFQPRMDFPTKNSKMAIQSKSLTAEWKQIDFVARPREYLESILRYCLDGNVETDFDMTHKTTNVWYHAPWMHYWKTGREPIHGMTFERPASVKYLSEHQHRVCQVWAVAFYNDVGAQEFGRIWENNSKPNLDTKVQFKEDSVVFKLLFTDATEDEVPYLQGSHEWNAYIADDKSNPGERRLTPSKLKLLQIDVAVKDQRSPVGWVFGTFMYHCNAPSNAVNVGNLQNLVPLCLQWGNDPTDDFATKKRLKETWINEAVEGLDPPAKPDKRPYWGFHGRANGPADNFKSSCLSCHSTASLPIGSDLATPAYIAPASDPQTVPKWFRNLKAGEKFDREMGDSLDYSLQMQNGLASYMQWELKTKPKLFLRRIVTALFS